MKKILCGILCASAGVALAVESNVTTIDVIGITSSLNNVVVAVPGLDLAGGDLAISNLVKTTGLTAGDKLYAFENGKYKGWELNDSGKWEEFIGAGQGSDGIASFDAGTPASSACLGVGKGIWLHRDTPSGTFYVYGAQTSKTSAVGSGVTLVGNPKTSNATPRSIDGLANGDKISLPTSGSLTHYNYSSAKNQWWHGGEYVDFPTIDAGTGFWYTPSDASGRTINW